MPAKTAAPSPITRRVRTGVWLVGARGSVATTAITGALALRAGLAEPVGTVTARPEFVGAGLPGFEELVFGGHDLTDLPLSKKAEQLSDAAVLPARLARALGDDLAGVDRNIRPAPQGATQRRQADLAIRDLKAFRIDHGLDRIVVVNLASTEPVPSPHPAHQNIDLLVGALAGPAPVLPASSLYAFAALSAGCPFVDFTPSAGARLPALWQLAERARLPIAGSDGKTGETLVKSVLGPMFAARNLRVNSWSGLNLLGGGDGATLAQPGPNAAKTASKHRVLDGTLGYTPPGPVRIEHVADLGDHKTAWDLITFSGFLGTGMRMDFTWHGCDSALAAPLVLDLARLTARAHQQGRTGPVGELGFFFKDPIGEGPHALADQWQVLRRFAASLAD